MEWPTLGPIHLSTHLCFFIKVGHPRPRFHLFSVFVKQAITLQQINVKNIYPISGAGTPTHNLLNTSPPYHH